MSPCRCYVCAKEVAPGAAMLLVAGGQLRRACARCGVRLDNFIALLRRIYGEEAVRGL